MRILFIVLSFLCFNLLEAQKGAKIGYIDMEYILKSAPDYLEAKNLLDQKALQWKQEIDVKRNKIKSLKETLQTERVLLTKELIEEREEEIAYLETELNEYQLQRFGPTGDLVMQKAVLVQPVQDQVFTILQDIAEKQNYDFILDKSSDLSLIFAAKRYDLSDRVIKQLSRSSKRKELTKKQLKDQLEKEAEEDFIDENPDLVAKQKAKEEALDAKRKEIEDRRNAAKEKQAQRKREYEEKRQKLIDAAAEKRKNKQNGTVSDTEPSETPPPTNNNEPKEE
uniref:OmpH family outer membrane protein n=3 Tax=Flavobacterium sp. TaxID=239 RepID=UPI004049CF47